MELTVAKRSGAKKSENNRIRREGNIPAVLYSAGKKGDNIAIEGPEFRKALKGVESGALPTTVFSLKKEGKAVKAILKDIQYHKTTYDIIHLDFEELLDKVPVTVNVPVVCVGANDCVGVKLGGVLRQVVRHMKVRCLPKHIPSTFEVDVRDLNLGQSIRFGEIATGENVQSLVDPKNIAVIIAKK